jgi:hypothetical protein
LSRFLSSLSPSFHSYGCACANASFQGTANVSNSTVVVNPTSDANFGASVALNNGTINATQPTNITQNTVGPRWSCFRCELLKLCTEANGTSNNIIFFKVGRPFSLHAAKWEKSVDRCIATR